MDYEVYLRREAFDFLRQLRRDDREHLLGLLRQLGRDPFQHGDFSRLKMTVANHLLEANRRPAAPPAAGPHFGSAFSARCRACGTAVAQLWRSMEKAVASRARAR